VDHSAADLRTVVFSAAGEVIEAVTYAIIAAVMIMAMAVAGVLDVQAIVAASRAGMRTTTTGIDSFFIILLS
jgi:hypothetical protein